MPIMKQKYVRKPLYVDAVQVTKANFAEVGAWCQGAIKNADGSPVTEINPVKGSQYIAIDAHNPVNARQKMAYVGDWILSTAQGFKIYTNKAFLGAFDSVDTPGAIATYVEGITTDLRKRDPADHIKPILGEVSGRYEGPDRRKQDLPFDGDDRRFTRLEVAEDDLATSGGRAH